MTVKPVLLVRKIKGLFASSSKVPETANILLCGTQIMSLKCKFYLETRQNQIKRQNNNILLREMC